MFRLPTQPQTIGKTLDVGFRLYAAGLKRILPLAAIAALISGIPNFLMRPGDEFQSGTTIAFLAFLPVIVIGAIVSMVGMLGSYNAVARGESLPLGAALKLGFRKLLPTLGAGLLYGLAVGGGLVLLIVPGIIIAVTLGLGMYGVVLENLGPLQALKRSHRLIWPGHWWRSVTVFSVPVFIMMIAMMAVGMPLTLVAAFVGEVSMAPRLINFAQVVVSTFTTPIMYAVIIVLYHDLKLRREGNDLLERIEAAPLPVS